MATFLSTSGNQIVDANGRPVKIAGVNWFGLESGRYAPDGLHVRNYREMMDQMADLGFNTIRLPFSDQLFEPGSRPNGIDYAKNPDLRNLSGLEIMDRIVAYAGEIGMRIILDHHRSSAGAGPNGNGLWYEGAYTEQLWIDNWRMLAQRYASDPTVIGADLHNEPHAASWDSWASAAERAGNAIHTVNPNWLMFVEGVANYQGEHYWWGGNLMGVRDRPVSLATPNKLVYSAHDYPNSIYGQPWFNDPNFPNNLPAKFDQMWGFIYKENIAPVFLGEFGSRLTDPKDIAWLDKLQAYLSGDFDANGTLDIPAGKQGVSWTWWSWNPNSGDTGGILADDWTTVLTGKVDELRNLMFDFDALPIRPNVVNGTAGDDVLTGSAGIDWLFGRAGDDRMSGGDGDDVLVGSIGRDVLNGGGGADRFVFKTREGVGANRDVVKFSHVDGDRIDLSALDADKGTPGNQVFTWLGSGSFTGVGGQLRFANNVLQGDVNGDRRADFEIKISGVLEPADIIL